MVLDTTSSLPRWLRPVASLFLYVFGLLLSLIVVPLSLLLLPRYWPSIRIAQQIQRDSALIWSDEGPEEAIQFLQRIYRQLQTSSKARILLPAYGKVSAPTVASYVAETLYSYHTQLDEWQHALDLAESWCQQSSPGFYSGWHIRKAKCLRQLGRQPEALELLLVARGHRSVSEEAERLLDAWRSTS